VIVEAPAIPFNKRRFDDPYMRIQAQAEERARRNGAVEAEIGAEHGDDSPYCGRRVPADPQLAGRSRM
jgi:hypothetical protein